MEVCCIKSIGRSIADNEIVKAEGVAKSINASGGRALAVAGDMLDANYLKVLVKKSAEFGKGKIHIIVNNAGYTWDGVIHKVWQTSQAQLHVNAMLGRSCEH